MKYENEIMINLPVDKVVELFDSHDNMFKWMPGLLSADLIEGEAGQPGAKTKMVFKQGKRDIEMIETILVRNLPEEFTGTYEAKNVYNHIKTSFIPIDDNSTKYHSENTFKMSGFMKIFALLMPGAFKKQTQKYLVLFKEFAEKEAGLS